MEKAASGATLPGDEPPLPNMRADFPLIAPKICPPFSQITKNTLALSPPGA